MTLPGEGDPVLERLLGELAPEDGSASGEVDPELLVGLVEGRLSDAEREAVLRQLAGSEAGRQVAGIVAELQEEGVLEPLRVSSSSAASASRRPRLRLYALAATLLLALGAALWAGGAFEAPAPDPDARLLAAAQRLASGAPDLLGGFRPLGAEERSAPPPAAQRGGIRVLRPAGTSLDANPTISWLPMPGATSYDVRILGEEGRVVGGWTTAETSLIWPPADGDLGLLERGRTYVAQVGAESPLGRVTGHRAFSIASEEQVQRFEATRRVIDEAQPEDLRAVLLAHAAIRAGFLCEAQRILGAHLEGHPDDALATGSLLYVRRQMGEPDAP